MILAHRRLRFTAALAGVATVAIAAARPAPTKYTDTTLPNGLRVIIAEDHAAPVFSIAVNYNVGSRNRKEKGRTGFAHLFEHMMFKGSENVGQGRAPVPPVHERREHDSTTNKDRTSLLRNPALEPGRPRALPRRTDRA